MLWKCVPCVKQRLWLYDGKVTGIKTLVTGKCSSKKISEKKLKFKSRQAGDTSSYKSELKLGRNVFHL